MNKSIKAIYPMADDASTHLGDMVTYDTQSGAVRLDGGVQA